MSFLQLVLSLDKTKDGFNSILPIVSFWLISQHPEWKNTVQIANNDHKNNLVEFEKRFTILFWVFE